MLVLKTAVSAGFDISLYEESGHIVRLDWSGASSGASSGAPTPLLKEAQKQLQAYFDGDLQKFDLPLAPQNTVFQKRVLEEMRAIPYGHTRTYGQLAKNLESAARAVGNACGANSIPVIIPCHRVLGASGLCGYSGAGGLETKLALLKLENPQFALL